MNRSDLWAEWDAMSCPRCDRANNREGRDCDCALLHDDPAAQRMALWIAAVLAAFAVVLITYLAGGKL